VRTTYISPQIEAILGYPVSSWLEQEDWFPTLLHPDDGDGVLEALERTHVNGEPFKAEYRLRAADGRWVWVLDETTAVRDREYRPLFLQGFMIDVTARRERDEELQHSQQLYRHVVEMSSDMIFVVDTGGTLIYTSPKITDLLGYKPEEVIGTPARELIEPADLPTVHEYFQRRLENAEVPPPTTRLLRKDGTHISVEGVISILRGEDGEPTGYVTVSRLVHRAALRPAAA
jgi:PAS domain S-box-containing protein